MRKLSVLAAIAAAVVATVLPVSASASNSVSTLDITGGSTFSAQTTFDRNVSWCC